MVTSEDLHKKYSGKKVFVTGHTGFKGSWLIKILYQYGSNIKGYALEPKTTNDIYHIINGDNICESVISDIREKEKLRKELLDFQPDFIFHLAAQPLVSLSFQNPVETIETNVNGTVNLLDAIRDLDNKCSIVIITTDKVYENQNWYHPYRENDRLGGYDPYSASKAAIEILIRSYRNSFFNINEINKHKKAIAVARAGNVIGGGDWSENRIIPDIIRAFQNNEPVKLRNPNFIRPWQHVLDALNGYLMLGSLLYDDPLKYSEEWNFGPYLSDQLKVIEVTSIAHEILGSGEVDTDDSKSFHETALLVLDISKAINILGWEPKWDSQKAIRETIEWYKRPSNQFTTEQIIEYYDL